MTTGREKPTEATTPDVEAKAAPTHRSRRNLVKAGLVASPLLMTLRSRPLHAAQSLGSLGIAYGGGLYVQNEDDEWVPAVEQTNDQGETELVPDPRGNDRREGTDDDLPDP